MPYLDFGALTGSPASLARAAAVCAPASALALLREETS